MNWSVSRKPFFNGSMGEEKVRFLGPHLACGFPSAVCFSRGECCSLLWFHRLVRAMHEAELFCRTKTVSFFERLLRGSLPSFHYVIKTFHEWPQLFDETGRWMGIGEM